MLSETIVISQQTQNDLVQQILTILRYGGYNAQLDHYTENSIHITVLSQKRVFLTFERNPYKPEIMVCKIDTLQERKPDFSRSILRTLSSSRPMRIYMILIFFAFFIGLANLILRTLIPNEFYRFGFLLALIVGYYFFSWRRPTKRQQERATEELDEGVIMNLIRDSFV